MRHAREQGKAEGRTEGKAEGGRHLLQKLLVLKFGELSAELVARLDAANLEQITSWAERVVLANNLDQVFYGGE